VYHYKQRTVTSLKVSLTEFTEERETLIYDDMKCAFGTMLLGLTVKYKYT